MATFASLFTGGGGADVGALQAGLVPIWGLEWNDAIAGVARDNGLHVTTVDVTKVNPADYEIPTILHASPPCPSFSAAKQGRQETKNDVALARAVCRFITILQPRFVSLENVWMYRRSESWRMIEDALNRLGYWTSLLHLNATDFGVPQTRKRMIVRAVRGGWLPPLPQPEPWQGWYCAVEDLLPDLPDSQFAPWQLERGVRDLLDQSYLLAQGSFDHADDGNERDAQQIGRRRATEPAFAITANRNMLGMRAFIVDGANTHGRDRTPTVRRGDEPMFTVDAQPPSKKPIRAAIPGRVVRMTPRCLARFQSVPDDYLLPDQAALATRIIGNMVPPLMMQRLLEPFA